MKRVSLSLLLCGLLFGTGTPALAADEDSSVVPLYAVGLLTGSSYDPHGHINFAQMSLSVLLDYEQVWSHAAPAPLRFKVEADLGLADWPEAARAMTSANIYALYYLGRRSSRGLRPYAEAGIGLIYADYQVAGQGLRFNFNPQLGLGVDALRGQGLRWFLALRLHHISNGNLFRENRGVNSWALQVGCQL